MTQLIPEYYFLVAQWIEQLPTKEKVTGSNPVLIILNKLHIKQTFKSAFSFLFILLISKLF